MEVSTFWSLPNEMKVAILEHLDPESKKTARLVCASWAALINPMLQLVPVLSDLTAQTIALSALPVVSLTVRRLQDPRSVPEVPTGRRSSLRSKESSLWLENVIHVVVGEHPVGASERNLQKLLRHCSARLEVLELEEWALRNVTRFQTMWTEMSFDRLTHLRILLNTYEVHHHSAVDSLLATHSFPKLADLRISFTDIRTPTFHHPVGPYTRIFNTVYNFIARHHPSLRNLWLNEAEELELDPDIHEPQPLVVRLPESTVQDLSKLNLSRLRLFLGNFDQNHPEWPVICLASNHSQLVTLDVWGAPVPQAFYSTIRNNVKTLKYLYWTSDFVAVDPDPWPPAPVQGQWQGGLENRPIPLNAFDIAVLGQATSLVHLDISANQILNFYALPVQIQRLVWSSNLTTEELVWIATNLKLLRILIVEENADNETGVPFITLEVLKLVLASAGKLELLKLYGQYEKEEIGDFCSAVDGLAFQERPDSQAEDELSRIKGRPGFRLEIDRCQLDPKDLERK